MRLIDADALMRDIEHYHLSDGKFQHWVEVQPTIEPMRWIPCSERLPEVGQSVLLSVAGVYAAEGCLRDDGDWAQFRWDATQRKDMVGAWMPLPEPWKGDAE